MKLRLLVVCVILLSSVVVGQTFRGTILGTVTDPSGNLVAGATVKVNNAATGLERTTITSADGSYTRFRVAHRHLHRHDLSDRLPDLGHQQRRSERGHRTARGRAIENRPGHADGRGLRRRSAQIETTSNDLGGVLTSQGVEDLPINGRDYTKLIFLNPGVAGSPDQITDSPGSFGEFSMNGARGRSNNYLLDGTDMNDGYRNDPAINQGGVFAVPSAILPIGAVAGNEGAI